VRADLRARWGQAFATAGVVAGVVAALILATMLLEGAVNPWQELFSRTRGADMLIYFPAGTRLGELKTLPGVQEVGTPSEAAPGTLSQEGEQSQVELRAMPLAAPAMSAPLVVAGTWLQRGNTDGVVVEASFAAALHLTAGDSITVDGVDGTVTAMRVIGIADTADQGFYPQWTPGLIWVQAPLLTRVEQNSDEREEVVGLRLADPADTGQVIQEVSNAFNSSSTTTPVGRVITRQQVMNSMASDDRLLGLLLALIGIMALVAAPCAIANVAAGRVLMQRRDLAMLKTLGFTPGQVIRMLLAEQAALGVAGTAAGLLIARFVTSPVFVTSPGGIPVTLGSLPLPFTALIAAGTVGTVAVATAIPAWRAGVLSPVAAVRPSPPSGHLSLLTRLLLLLRLPAALVLGAREPVTRRLPAALTVLGVAIPMVMITIALACWSTIGSFTADPARIGLAAALRVSPVGLTSEQVNTILDRDAQVAATYPGAEFDPLLPADNGTFVADAMGTSSQQPKRQYPFRVVQGRMYQAPSEAIAGQGLLDMLHLKVGQWFNPTIDGVPMIFHIVGQTIDARSNGDVLGFELDALKLAGAAPQPAFWSVVLKPGVSPAQARERLLSASGGGLNVQVVRNPADGFGVVRVVIVIAVIVLGLIGLANLLTVTAIGMKDHLHESLILEAMGLTPRQVVVIRVVAAAILACAGAGLGIGAGLIAAPRLINAQGQASGIGWGIAAGLSPAMIAGMIGCALIAATAAALFLATARRGTFTRPEPVS
jgi:putative ABC transport system permease protein